MKMRVVCVVGLLAQLAFAAAPEPFGNHVHMAGSLQNARTIFTRTGRGTVAFLGGSITEREGYRPLVCADLKKRYPKTSFTFIPAGISSTCSSTGAFRLDRDILSKGKIDLLFVEFAVNDDQDGHFSRERCIRGMEGIIRHARLNNPAIDIVMTFFVNESILAAVQSGKLPLTLEAHGSVAAHYQIPTINVPAELADQIRANRMTWETYGGVHPASPGNRLAADMINELFNRYAAVPLSGNVVPHELPEPLDAASYFRGRLLPSSAVKITRGWKIEVPAWSAIPGSVRSRFVKEPMFCATTEAEASLAFDGTCIGAYLLAGPDAGWVEASIDGQPFTRINLFQPFSDSLHYPCTVFFADGLAKRHHQLAIRFPPIPENQGKAARFLSFVGN